MPNRESYLVALRPPSNIEGPLIKVQSEIFYTHGLVSARALTPLIPLAFFFAPPSAPPRFRQPVPLETTTWLTSGDVLFFGVEPAARLGELIESVKARPASTASVIPAAPGLYIADCSASPDSAISIQRAYRGLRRVPPIRWASSELVCLRLETAAGAWWDEIRCEEIWSTRLFRAPSGAGSQETE